MSRLVVSQYISAIAFLSLTGGVCALWNDRRLITAVGRLSLCNLRCHRLTFVSLWQLFADMLRTAAEYTNYERDGRKQSGQLHGLGLENAKQRQ